MNYQEAKVIKESLYKEFARTSAILEAYTKGPMGLTLDVTKASKEWKFDYAACSVAFKKLRDFNGNFSKIFKKEMISERKAKYAELTKNSSN